MDFNIDKILLALQLIIFVVSRLAVDLCYYSQFAQQAFTLLDISIGGLFISICIKIFRACKLVPNLLKTLFWIQVKFYIPYCITGIAAYFYNYSFKSVQNVSAQALTTTTIVLTTMNYSLVSDYRLITLPQFLVFTIVLMAQIIQQSTLFIKFADVYDGVQKDSFMLFVATFITIQAIMMDIIAEQYQTMKQSNNKFQSEDDQTLQIQMSLRQQIKQVKKGQQTYQT